MSEIKPKKPRPKINSRQKGARGEREFAQFLIDEFGIEARRGIQFRGGADSPDVISDLDEIHFEVKRTESLSIYKAMEQAIRDGVDKVPCVAHRRSRQDWLLCIRAKDVLSFIAAFKDVKKST